MPKMEYYKVFYDVCRQFIGEATFKEIELKAIKRSGGLGRWGKLQLPIAPLLAFVGMGPGKIDMIRKKNLAGAAGRVFVKKYLEPMELTRDAVIITNIFKEEQAGEPAPDKLAAAVERLKKELNDKRPDLIIALGQNTKKALGDYADFVLPHPDIIAKFGSRGEIDRKLKQITKACDDEDYHFYETEPEHMRVQILKADREQQLVYGVILEPDTYDAHGDKVSPEEIEQAAHLYMIKSQIIGRQHSEKANAKLVESSIAPIDYEINGAAVKQGSWVAAVKVLDPNLWADIKEGKVTGFSIGGLAEKKPIDGGDAK